MRPSLTPSGSLWASTAAGGLALTLALIGCGPPRAGDADGVSSTAMSSTSASSDTSGETGADPSSTGPDPTTFLPEDDVVVQYCDTWEQDCPEGEKCVPHSSGGGAWNSTTCVPIAGDQGPGDPCVSGGAAAATDDCGAGSFCWDVEEIDGELIGECVLMCTGSVDAPTCPDGSYCSVASGPLNMCLVLCDPLVQACEVGDGCYWTYNEFTCLSTDGEGIEPGQPCGFINDCAPGSVCVHGDAVPACAGVDPACCTPYCSLEVGDPGCAAAPGTSCVPFFEEGMAPPGYDNIGICVLP